MKNIVTISAFTAIGDMQRLEPALNAGLDAGLSINEIKESLVHLYAYTGFPRSLNALGLFMKVLDERKAAGKMIYKAKKQVLYQKILIEINLELK